MKEDYLWDKSGNDEEIASLENALAVFRYRETAPPEIPAEVVPFKNESVRPFPKVAFSIAACLALAVILLGIWFQISVIRPNAKLELVQINAPKIEATTVVEEQMVKTSDVTDEKPKVSKIKAQKFVKTRKPVFTNVKQNQTVARSLRQKPRNLHLTEEEKYAYDQLMLALAITGSKLKEVKDKVGGME